jgi:hypothetical protein
MSQSENSQNKSSSSRGSILWIEEDGGENFGEVKVNGVNGVGSWKRVFFQQLSILKRRVATRDVVFVGTCPTIEIVGLGLSRRFATHEMFIVGSVPRLKWWARG